MYHDFYGLSVDPFRLSPDHSFCLSHSAFAEAKACLQSAAARSAGFVMVTGCPGTGKTTLIEEVLSQLHGGVAPATLDSTRLSGEELLHMVAFHFGVHPGGHDYTGLLGALQEAFAALWAGGQRPLLVVDEAQGLTPEALQALWQLSGLCWGKQPMLLIFLVGQDELRDRVLDPGMRPLQQRLIASHHLAPLDLKQTAAYVMHRLKIGGWSGWPRIRADIFPPLYSFSRGVPRRINLFMGRLMLGGWLEEKNALDGADADQVLGELRQEYLVPAGPVW